MRRINVTFCAGGCGKVMRLRHAPRPGEPICQPCRKVRRTGHCGWCRKRYEAKNRSIQGRFCSPEHWYAYRNWDRETDLTQTYDVALEVLNQED